MRKHPRNFFPSPGRHGFRSAWKRDGEAEAIESTDLSPNLAESKQRYALPQNLGRTFV